MRTINENAVNENAVKVKTDRMAEEYFHKYKPQMESLESKSVLSKVRPISTYDYYTLGKMLESWDVYREISEADGSLSQMGTIPHVAYDIITLTYGTSPIGVVCSTQPINEELGSIYYKQIVAQSTRGNVTAGQVLFHPNVAPEVEAMDYATERMTDETVGTTVAGTLAYAATAIALPIRPFTVKVDVENLTATDDGSGKLIGYNIQGVINYSTGAVTVELRNDPGDGKLVKMSYSQDMEAAPDIPKIIMRMTSKPVRAHVYALKDTVGLEQSYAMRKRFGMVADDELSVDLVAAINAELMNKVTYLAGTRCIGNVNWSKTPPDGVSYFEHKQELMDVISRAEANIVGSAGRGSVNVIIAGRNAASYLSVLPGFTKISDGTTIGPHIYGTLSGITIIRIPTNGTLSPDQLVCMFKGTSPFESPIVYAPYMPLILTQSLPAGVNPLLSQRAVATWCAIDTLVPEFMTKVTITA